MKYKIVVEEVHIKGGTVSLGFTNNVGYGDRLFMTIVEWVELGKPIANNILSVTVCGEKRNV